MRRLRSGASHDREDGGGGRAAGPGSMSDHWPAPTGGSTGGPAGKGYAGPDGASERVWEITERGEWVLANTLPVGAQAPAAPSGG